jgi:hypothetical protein
MMWCDICAKNVPPIIEDCKWDNFFEDGERVNKKPWGDIVCPDCKLVLMTYTADVEGRLIFVEDASE